MTRIEEERAVQKSWRLKRPEAAPFVDRLIQREFFDPQQAHDAESLELGRMLRFANSEVPFYRSQEVWSALALDESTSRDTLTQLPVITKHDVQANTADLQAQRLPRGEKVLAWTGSSGTTGRPTRVLFSQRAALVFGLLVQRQLRWVRADPSWTQAVIRLSRDLQRRGEGLHLADGEIIRSSGWMYLKRWFHTGPMIGLNNSNSIERQIELLHEQQPEYLVTFPGNLEALVLACQAKPVDSLLALRTISSTLTQGMRNRIESATSLSVQEGYGLNEIGVVAHRCGAGRYHVNAEHCLVEILDDAGQPCRAGETGRIVVTGLTNFAMPLIRYDCGDLAEAVEGSCDCGRSLPSFGRVVGRFRPMRYAPDGTSRCVDLITQTIDDLSVAALADLRGYQIHQFIDGSFELRLVTVGEPGEVLVGAIRQAWDAQIDASTLLRILKVDEIPTPRGGKRQEFTSDFFPSIDEY
jgi:phenylacetate-CoA ligase